MFILGTANFGNCYLGSKLNLDNNQAYHLLQEFIGSGGIQLDTAETYGKSLNIIKNLKVLKFNIGTKFSSKIMLEPKSFSNYLNKLKFGFGTRLKYCLLHDSTFISEIPQQSFVILDKFLNESTDLKFGVSIYNFSDLKQACRDINRISIVQVPLNYFDRRFICNEFLSFCADNDIEINYRSIFLQGKILSSSKFLNPYFRKFEEFKFYYSDFENSECNSLLIFNIEFIKSVTDFSKVVIGVESPAQLIEVIEVIKEKKSLLKLDAISDIQFNEDLCIPMNWRLA